MNRLNSCAANPLALSLLMAWITTDDEYDAASADNFAPVAHPFDACSNLHGSLYLRVGVDAKRLSISLLPPPVQGLARQIFTNLRCWGIGGYSAGLGRASFGLDGSRASMPNTLFF